MTGSLLAQFVVQLGEIDTLHLSGIKYLDVMVVLYGNSWEMSGKLRKVDKRDHGVLKGREGLRWDIPSKGKTQSLWGTSSKELAITRAQSSNFLPTVCSQRPALHWINGYLKRSFSFRSEAKVALVPPCGNREQWWNCQGNLPLLLSGDLFICLFIVHQNLLALHLKWLKSLRWVRHSCVFRNSCHLVTL